MSSALGCVSLRLSLLSLHNAAQSDCVNIIDDIKHAAEIVDLYINYINYSLTYLLHCTLSYIFFLSIVFFCFLDFWCDLLVYFDARGSCRGLHLVDQIGRIGVSRGQTVHVILLISDTLLKFDKGIKHLK